MPLDSQYTEKVVKYMRTAKRPVTATEIQEAVGMSRQGAYHWLKNEGADYVVPVGVGRNSATAYVLKDGAEQYAPRFRPHGIWTVDLPRGRGKAKKPDIRLNAVFRITSMKVEEGDTIVEFTDTNGATFTLNFGDLPDS